MAESTQQFSALSRLFSPAVFREMAARGYSPTFARLFRLCSIQTDAFSKMTVADGFDAAFSKLKRAGVRDEYIYRAAIAQKILLGKHSLNTASMLSEFRAGACKADLVILNGTATAYEIKSERDSLARLSRQISSYRKVFGAVNVITCNEHLEGVIAEVPEDVGLMLLSSRYQIQTVRDSINQPERTCPITTFESLRLSEARNVLKLLGVSPPNVPNTRMHGEMRKLFAEQDPANVHHAMVMTLKRTRSLASLAHLVGDLPNSLHAAALSIATKKRSHELIVEAMSTPIKHALRWA